MQLTAFATSAAKLQHLQPLKSYEYIATYRTWSSCSICNSGKATSIGNYRIWASVNVANTVNKCPWNV